MNLSYIGKSKSYVLPLFASCFFAAAVNLHKNSPKPIIKVTAQDSAINFSSLFLKIGSMGNKRLVSDLIWTQTLLQSDVEHYKKKDFNNWMFLRFNAISELDPQFYENYLYGGQFLNIVKDDLIGAAVIFKKGIEIFPEDYKLNFNAGFLYYFEEGDLEMGLKYMEKIQYHKDAPVFFPSIVNKLKVTSGNYALETIYELVKNQHKTTQDEHLKIRLEKDLYSIKSEIDLLCLNNKMDNCSRLDYYNIPYTLKTDGYHTQRPFNIYRLNKKGGHKSPPIGITTLK